MRCGADLWRAEVMRTLPDAAWISRDDPADRPAGPYYGNGGS